MTATWRGIFAWGRAERRRRSLAPAVRPLEPRALLAQSNVTINLGVTASVVPNVIYPPSGKYVPVTVSGTVTEYQVTVNGPKVKVEQLKPSQIKDPPPTGFRVVDEYRQVEPRGPIKLVPEDSNYSFQFTTYLKASRTTQVGNGRLYSIIVGSQGPNGSAGKVVPVQVPISLKDRGEPPQKVPPTKAHPAPKPQPPKKKGLFGL